VESEIARAAIKTPNRGNETGHVLNIERVRLEPLVYEVRGPAGTPAALGGIRTYRELVGVLPAITVRV
jgi:hypothetical protein